MKILVAEDDPVAAFSLVSLVEDLGHSVEMVEDGTQALQAIATQQHDVVFSDWIMPEIDGLELCRRVRANTQAPYIYIILVTSRATSEDRREALETGADDFLIKPADLSEVRVRLIVAERILRMQAELRNTMSRLTSAYAELELANSQLHMLASTDGLTAIDNHRAFQDHITREAATAARSGCPLSLLLLDIDRFKLHNDTYGHQAGDDVLKKVAQILKGETRASDYVARYGGEEFVAILTDTDEMTARVVAERFRAAVEAGPWPVETITISVGASTHRGPIISPPDLISLADRAMYMSKLNGRNRITHASDPMGE